jgi:arylsulfatase A-like enzyme
MPNLLVNGGEILWIIIFAGAAGIVVFIERALHCHRAQINSTEFLNGVRTVSWKYIYYPSGDGTPDRYGAELYNLATDPLETHNLIADLAAARQLAELKKASARLMAKHKAVPDRMPPDGGIINVLPKF